MFEDMGDAGGIRGRRAEGDGEGLVLIVVFQREQFGAGFAMSKQASISIQFGNGLLVQQLEAVDNRHALAPESVRVTLSYGVEFWHYDILSLCRRRLISRVTLAGKGDRRHHLRSSSRRAMLACFARKTSRVSHLQPILYQTQRSDQGFHHDHRNPLARSRYTDSGPLEPGRPFPGSDSPELKTAFSDLEERVKTFEQVRDRLDVEMEPGEFQAIIAQLEALSLAAYRIYSFAGLWFAEDTNQYAPACKHACSNSWLM